MLYYTYLYVFIFCLGQLNPKRAVYTGSSKTANHEMGNNYPFPETVIVRGLDDNSDVDSLTRNATSGTICVIISKIYIRKQF